MNIKEAAKYLQDGYRITRKDWNSGEFLYNLGGMLAKRALDTVAVWDSKTNKTVNSQSFVNDFNFSTNISDLLAEDWFVILAGMIPYKNPPYFQYDDEFDYDD